MAGTPLQLPNDLAQFLNMLGYTWPKADEVRMFELGGKWLDFGGKLQEIQGESASHGQRVTAENLGKDIDAFLAKFESENSAPKTTQDGGTGAMVVGAGLFVAAALVLALKITVIVQLVTLAIQIASAIAAAGPTFGASMAWIPVAKKLADMAINLAIELALNQLLG
jgi:hypothetical protein